MPLEKFSTQFSLQPFDLSDEGAYTIWRNHKLLNYPEKPEALFVRIKDMQHLTKHEMASIYSILEKTNMCLYQLDNPASVSKAGIKQLAQQFGLKRLDANICADEDSISSLQTRDSGRHAGYIPYTNRKLSWHTDGYYNKPENTIRAMLLHCVNNAAKGGENAYLDHEILYIHLRDKNPSYIHALMDSAALTIPPNEEAGAERAAQSGPVFSLDKDSGSLHLRYTARTRSIEWDNVPILLEAVEEIRRFLNSNSDYIFKYKLHPGEGVICNNVLHNRTAFEEGDDAEGKRFIYRARFYDRVKASST